MTIRLQHILFAAALAGCGVIGSNGGGNGGDDGKGDLASGHSLYPTNQSGLALFQGFNTLYDENSAPCVDPVAQTTSAPYTVGDLQESYELVYVKDKADISKSVNVDFGLAASVFRFVNFNATFNLVNSYHSSATSVQFLLAARQNYSVNNNRPVQLQAGIPDPSKDINAFMHRCQNYYVNGIKFEADLFVLITFDTVDQQTSDQIKASLGVTTNLPGGAILGNVDGHLTGALVNTAAMSGVSTSVVAASRGFLLSGSNASIIPLGDSLTPDTFTTIDGLRGSMAASITNDQCRDTGDAGTMCGNAAAPGYEKNQARNASPVGVLLGSYQRATNAPYYGSHNPYQAMDAELQQAETFVRSYTKLAIQISNIYDQEVGSFWNASATDKRAYQLVQSPLYAVTDLQTAMQPWHDAFLPDDGQGNIGTATKQVQDIVKACWDQGSDAVFDACHLGNDPTTLPDYMAVQAQIQNYAQGSRIRPLQFAIPAKATSSGQASAACAGLSLDGGALQLPSWSDANALNLVIAAPGLPAPSNSGDANMVWMNDNFCGGSIAGFQSQAGGLTESCPGNVSLPVVCVPADGAFGIVPDVASL